MKREAGGGGCGKIATEESTKVRRKQEAVVKANCYARVYVVRFLQRQRMCTAFVQSFPPRTCRGGCRRTRRLRVILHGVEHPASVTTAGMELPEVMMRLLHRRWICAESGRSRWHTLWWQSRACGRLWPCNRSGLRRR